MLWVGPVMGRDVAAFTDVLADCDSAPAIQVYELPVELQLPAENPYCRVSTRCFVEEVHRLVEGVHPLRTLVVGEWAILRR